MTILRTLLAAALSASLSLSARAQGPAPMPGMDHGGQHTMPGSATVDGPATREFRAVDAQMHRDMGIRYTGDVDVDFVRGMIPHHEGAIGMARVALRHSKDPAIRKLAEDIVKAQGVEITQMQDFLKRHGAK